MKFLLLFLLTSFVGLHAFAGLGTERRKSLERERNLSPQLPERMLPVMQAQAQPEERFTKTAEPQLGMGESWQGASAEKSGTQSRVQERDEPGSSVKDGRRKMKKAKQRGLFSWFGKKRDGERPKRNLRAILSSLWTFATINYVYADLVGFMDAGMLAEYLVGVVNGIQITSGFLLGAAIFMQIPISMIFLSRILKGKTNKKANVVAGIIMSVVQALTLFVGVPSAFYIFFSIVEILATLTIAWLALKAKPADWEPQG